MHIVTAEQMQELDRATIEDIGIAGIVLMENAGRGTADYILRTFPDTASRRIMVLCGRGNNGGDGYVIARCLLNAGAGVCVLLISERSRVQGDARINLDILHALGGRIIEITNEAHLQQAQNEIVHARLFVDALLGTGLSSEVTGLYRRVIETVAHCRNTPVVAVDIPSGIDATSGRVLGCALQAHSTCTFGLPKYGHVLYPGADHTGKLTVIDIGIPAQVIDRAGLQGHLQSDTDCSGMVPQRAPDAHKGTCGHVLLLAGSLGKTGAAVLSARAAMRSGAGLVTVAAPQQALVPIAAQLQEAMSVALADCSGMLSSDSLQQIITLCAGKSLLALGPGLGNTDAVADIVRDLIANIEIPLIIDADGLNALAREPQILNRAAGPVILTPHPGEMARLTGQTTDRIQANRVDAACGLASAYGVLVVLKGARTVIAAPDGHHWINMSGNAAMAGAGMGDVLTGMIAGLLSQNIPALEAARAAVFLHGNIADRIVQERGPAPILASELIERMPDCLMEMFT